jgi:hypothetical protein
MAPSLPSLTIKGHVASRKIFAHLSLNCVPLSFDVGRHRSILQVEIMLGDKARLRHANTETANFRSNHPLECISKDIHHPDR